MLRTHHISSNSLTVKGEFRRLVMIIFANTLDPDQNVGPDLDPNRLTLF